MRIVTFYIYSSILPSKELTLYRCVKCSRPLFKAGGEIMVISNAKTPDFQTYKPNTTYLEIQCHSCKTEYKVVYV